MRRWVLAMVMAAAAAVAGCRERTNGPSDDARPINRGDAPSAMGGPDQPGLVKGDRNADQDRYGPQTGRGAGMNSAPSAASPFSSGGWGSGPTPPGMVPRGEATDVRSDGGVPSTGVTTP